jgi:Ser-tRNA(Ala) deacylase AlaX
MTEHLYQFDSYLREFDAVIAATDGQSVTLDRTAFYPGGGGQPADVGLLTWESGSAQVVKVKPRGAELWHALDGDPPPQGAAVRGTLDWARRYRLNAHPHRVARAVRCRLA